ncbi:MAG: asparagine synthase-related protein [Desulfobacterales bacterium]
MSIDAAEDQFYDLFSDAVQTSVTPDVEVGSLISGGIDSSAVSARVADYQPSVPLFFRCV